MRNLDDERSEQEPTGEDLEVAEEEAEGVTGGLSPPSPPAGPIPIPYPNTGKTSR